MRSRLTRPPGVRYHGGDPAVRYSLPLLVCLLASSAWAETPAGHRAELEELRRLSAELSAALALGRLPAGRQAAATPRLRDRLPDVLVSHPVEGGPAAGEATGEPPPAPVLPPGVLEAGRYDLPMRWNRDVAAWVGFFLGRGRPLLARWLARKGRYEELIVGGLERRGLPRDLIWLVLVESGFSPVAVSRASATGMWQFMEATAADYGLVVDRWVDERRSPEKSTAAGCELLAHLHRRFGTWELAMGAYNTGVGLVSEAMRRYNNNDFWTVTRYEYLPSGTRQYVAKILAAAIVGKHADAFGFSGIVPERPLATVGVTVKGGTRLSAVAKAAGVRPEEIEVLNPELVRARVPPSAKEWEVFIPAERLERFTRRFDRKARARGPMRRHVLRFGETLRDVSRAYGVKRRVLRVLNGLASDRAARPGLELRVPVPPARRPKPPPKPAEPETVVMPAVDWDVPGHRRVLFRVRRGTSLAGVAAHFGAEPAVVAAYNGLDPRARLQPGMVLRVWVPEDRDLSDTLLVDPGHVRIVVADSEEFAAAHASARKAREARKGPKAGKRVHYVRHKVRRGETLSKIARRYRTTSQAIARINRINPNRLRPGQVLRIRRGAKR